MSQGAKIRDEKLESAARALASQRGLTESQARVVLRNAVAIARMFDGKERAPKLLEEPSGESLPPVHNRG